MSEPKRYEPDHEGLMHPTPKGNYVLMQDYALLKAAFHLLDESIKLGPSAIPLSPGYYVWKESEQYDLKAENARLKAEVERLTKENETITKDKVLLWASHKIALQDIQGLHYALQTAKEGKQS